MRVAIITSVVVHALLVLWFAHRRTDDREGAPAAAPARIVELEYTGVVVLPNDVQLAAIDPATLLDDTEPRAIDPETRPATLDPPDAKALDPAARPRDTLGSSTPPDDAKPRSGDRSAPPDMRRATANRIATSRSLDPGASRSDRPTGDRPNPLAMRKPTREPPGTFTLSGTFMDDFLAKPRAPIPDVPGARIDARLAELEWKRRHPPPGYNWVDDVGELVALREQKQQLELKKQKDGSYVAEKPTYVARVAPDGTVDLHDKPNVQREGLGARFDVTDAVMRAFGQDPYASHKLELLDRTRDQRVALGNEHKQAVAERARSYATAAIERAWAAAPDLAAKKRVLFDLWDECAETGRADLVKAGADARAFIINFIQWKLAGPSAYTADELRALNARRTSKALFAPYATPPDHPRGP